jgi:predicted dehydrogenase
MMVRLGLIGAGKWGRNYIKTIAGMRGVTLARIASRNPETRDLVRDDCIISSDWRDVAGAKDLDGIIIATPPSRHARMVATAVESGIPVIVEKPLTANLAEARQLLDIVRHHGGYVLVDHIHLFSPAWSSLKDSVKRLGPVRRIEAEAGNYGPFRPDTTVLWDWGPHDLAMCIDLMGAAPERIEAFSRERMPMDTGLGESLEMILRFEGETEARITLSNIYAERRRRFSVHCDDGAVIYDDTAPDNRKLVVTAKHGGRTNATGAEGIALDREAPLARMLHTFLERIRLQRFDAASLSLGVSVVECLDRADRSLSLGGAIC